MNTPPSSGDSQSDSENGSRFPVTRWTLIGRIQGEDEQEAARALEEVFATYRYPLYGYLRSTGLHHEDAEDILQNFFLKLFRLDSLKTADSERGKLRTFLLSALSRFRINWARDQQRQRGPEKAESDLWDEEQARYQRDRHTNGETPELFYDRQWARELVARSLGALEDRCRKSDRQALFDILSPALSLDSTETFSVADAAARLNLTDNALRVALHRLRQDFRKLLHEEVAKTVKDETLVREEISHLISLFERSS